MHHCGTYWDSLIIDGDSQGVVLLTPACSNVRRGGFVFIGIRHVLSLQRKHSWRGSIIHHRRTCGFSRVRIHALPVAGPLNRKLFNVQFPPPCHHSCKEVSAKAALAFQFDFEKGLITQGSCVCVWPRVPCTVGKPCWFVQAMRASICAPIVAAFGLLAGVFADQPVVGNLYKLTSYQATYQSACLDGKTSNEVFLPTVQQTPC
jgi:hypothetical protein